MPAAEGPLLIGKGAPRRIGPEIAGFEQNPGFCACAPLRGPVALHLAVQSVAGSKLKALKERR